MVAFCVIAPIPHRRCRALHRLVAQQLQIPILCSLLLPLAEDRGNIPLRHYAPSSRPRCASRLPADGRSGMKSEAELGREVGVCPGGVVGRQPFFPCPNRICRQGLRGLGANKTTPSWMFACLLPPWSLGLPLRILADLHRERPPRRNKTVALLTGAAVIGMVLTDSAAALIQQHPCTSTADPWVRDLSDFQDLLGGDSNCALQLESPKLIISGCAVSTFSRPSYLRFCQGKSKTFQGTIWATSQGGR